MAEGHRAGRLSMRCCPTLDMLAEALTKMAAATVMEALRRGMHGELPPIPGEIQQMSTTDQTWWASLVLSTTISSVHAPVASAVTNPSVVLRP